MFIPNYAEAQTNESLCKTLHRQYVQGVGYQLNEQRYEKCVEDYDNRDYWRDMRPWGLGIFFLLIFIIVGIAGIKGRSKTTTYDTSYNPSYDISYNPSSNGAYQKDMNKMNPLLQILVTSNHF